MKNLNLDSPILLVEKNCEGKCQVLVTNLVENIELANFNIYSVGFKEMP